MGRMKSGILAGVVGAEALNMTTYLDIAVRGRPDSDLPSKAAKMLGETARISALTEETDKAVNRRRGVGALTGYLNGISLGVAYGLASPVLRRMRYPAQALIVAVAAMLSSNVPATLSGLTDPRDWTVAGWLEDLVPHLAYGAAAVWAYETIEGRGDR